MTKKLVGNLTMGIRIGRVDGRPAVQLEFEFEGRAIEIPMDEDVALRFMLSFLDACRAAFGVDEADRRLH